MNVEYEVNVNFEKGEWTFQEWWNGNPTGPYTVHNMETRLRCPSNSFLIEKGKS